MKRKKKGSSLVLVVFITALIITTGTMMLTVVSSDYKSRINKSKQVKNLYEADSGLNYVKNIIVKEAELAEMVANNNVIEQFPTLMNNAKLSDEAYEKVNKEFKKYFIKALTSNSIKESEVHLFEPSSKFTDSKSGKEYTAEEVENLAYSIETLTYRMFDDQKGISETDEQYNNRMEANKKKIKSMLAKDGTTALTKVSDSFRKNLDTTKQVDDIQIVGFKVEGLQDTDSVYRITVEVESTFKDKTIKSGIDNTKTVKVKFNVEAPDYSQSIQGVSTDVTIYNYGFNRAITADGDMIINSGDVNVIGDAWIKGSKAAGDKDVNSKYKGGVEVKDGNLLMDGNLYTNGTLSLDNESNAAFGKYDEDGIPIEDENVGNVYSLNVYTAPKSDAAHVNLFGVTTKLVTNNDLVINSSGTLMQINNYYGINDKTTGNVANHEGSADGALATKQSSSILINNTEDNFLRINNAYIAGVAYIDFNGNKYQTGESVSVKGNYKAYTDILPEIDDAKLGEYEDQEGNKYELIEGDLKYKANYFQQYFQNEDNISTLKDGGVFIKNIYCPGAYVNTDSDKEEKFVGVGSMSVEKIDEKIKTEQEKFTEKVLCMDDLKDNDGNPLTSEDIEEIYNNYEVVRGVVKSGEVNGKKLRPLIKFSEYDELIVPNKNEITEIDDKLYKFLYNPKEGLTVVVKSDGVYTRATNGDEKKVINKSNYSKDTVEAVIITRGNVIFEGDEAIRYVGTIIAGGNVIFNAKNVEVIYGETVYDDKENDKGDTEHKLPIAAKVNLTVSNSTEVGGQVAEALNRVYPSKVPEESIKIESKPVVYFDNYSGYDSGRYLKEGLWKIISKNN